METTETLKAPEQTQTAEIGELAAALAAAQAEITNAVKTSVNPFYKSRYADLATVFDACRAPLAKNGLAVIQTTDGTDGARVEIITTLAHKSGQWIRGRLVMRAEKIDAQTKTVVVGDPQTVGKCITYARRYALAAIVGVAPEDDDGNSASGVSDKPDAHHAAPKPAPAKPAKPAAPPPAAAEQIPDRLQALMAESNVSIYGLRKYLIGKGWIRPEGLIASMSRDIYHEMIKPENWAKVADKITNKVE